MPISNSARLAGATAFALLTGLGSSALATEPDQSAEQQTDIEEGSAAPAPEAREQVRPPRNEESRKREVRQVR